MKKRTVCLLLAVVFLLLSVPLCYILLPEQKAKKRDNTLVHITDISSTRHNLGVTVSGVDDSTAIQVIRHGKNAAITKFNNKVVEGIAKNEYMDTENRYLEIVGFAPGALYTLSVDGSPSDIVYSAEGSLLSVNVNYTDGTLQTVPLITTDNYTKGHFAATFGVAEKTISAVFISRLSHWTRGTLTLNNLQVEVGDTATGYEPFAGSDVYIPSADGVVSGVTSLYPTTVLFSDTAGVVITCKYKKNTNSNENTKPSEPKEGALKWEGKTWICVGDSITQKTACSDKNYHDYIAEETGIIVDNRGVGGTGYYTANKVGNFATRILRDNFPTDADVVTIFGGGNDTGIGIENIGTPAGAIAGTETDTFCAYVVAAINAVHTKMPTASLGVITPTPWRGTPPYDEDGFFALASDAIVEICRLLSVPCLDLYHCSGLRPWDKDFRDLVYNKDRVTASGQYVGEFIGVHPNEIGHEIIATKIKAFLETLIM